MNKPKITNIIFGSLVTLVVIGIALIIWMLFHPILRNNVIRVDVEDNGEKIVSFEKLNIIPGDIEEYTIKLKSEVSCNYQIVFDFQELEDKGLKEYVYIKIQMGDEVLCDKLLKDVFEDEAITFECAMKKRKRYDIKVTYYMLETVGNEAKNTESTFNLVISATNK